MIWNRFRGQLVERLTGGCMGLPMEDGKFRNNCAWNRCLRNVAANGAIEQVPLLVWIHGAGV